MGTYNEVKPRNHFPDHSYNDITAVDWNEGEKIAWKRFENSAIPTFTKQTLFEKNIEAINKHTRWGFLNFQKLIGKMILKTERSNGEDCISNSPNVKFKYCPWDLKN